MERGRAGSIGRTSHAFGTRRTIACDVTRQRESRRNQNGAGHLSRALPGGELRAPDRQACER